MFLIVVRDLSAKPEVNQFGYRTKSQSTRVDLVTAVLLVTRWKTRPALEYLVLVPSAGMDQSFACVVLSIGVIYNPQIVECSPNLRFGNFLSPGRIQNQIL